MKCLAFFTGCSILALALAGCGRSNPAPSKQAVQWEYRFVGASLEQLRAAGNDGWEAFAIDRAENGGTIMWLKRPLLGDHP